MSSPDDTLRKIEDPAKRAAFTIDSLSSGGQLPTEVATQFVEIAVNDTPMLRECTLEKMSANSKKLPKIGFTGPIVRTGPGDDTALADGVRAAPATTETTLTTKEYLAVVPVGYQALEENVEGMAAFQQRMLRMIAEQWGVDIEALALGSDTTIVDSTLVARGYARQDGWLKLITSNVVNFSSAYISRSGFESVRVSVAAKYRRNRKHKFFAGEKAANRWRETIADRATAAGDAAMSNPDLPMVGGTNVIEVSNMPVTTGTPDTAPIIFTDPKNLIVGVRTGIVGGNSEGISMKVEDDPKYSRVNIYVRARLAFAVMHEPAAAKGTNVRA